MIWWPKILECWSFGKRQLIRQKLERHRPSTLAQVLRIDGITPAALMLVLAHIRKASRAA
ncbi:MAG: hypothetical protein ACLPX9_19240 [Rhodomicrobium sp.]